MRTALCLYGQPRFYKETFERYFKHIIEQYSADVFLHTWWSKDHVGQDYPCRVRDAFTGEDIEVKESAPEDLIKLYSPKIVQYEWYDTNNVFEKRSNFFQYYTQYAVKNLKRLYEEFHSFRYDAVIHTRFDYVTSTLRLGDLDMEKLNVPDTCPNPSLYCDAMTISNSVIHDKIADTYEHLTEYESTGEGHCEYAFIRQIRKENLQVNKMPIIGDAIRSNSFAFRFIEYK